ncbi:hypothetical protein FB567DRAFT_614136 [Paraphoma chrysanthemicola]|uniref:Uncharacterized protein n=1 Tax=Paraphoma chrysanthemicola TaxID=798071 RepID=A0A8K0RDS8_9PLEO|nr:hypothetical protein FB567DRAFT_614136 [Paraphoma chrysanthemicola]
MAKGESDGPRRPGHGDLLRRIADHSMVQVFGSTASIRVHCKYSGSLQELALLASLCVDILSHLFPFAMSNAATRPVSVVGLGMPSAQGCTSRPTTPPSPPSLQHGSSSIPLVSLSQAATKASYSGAPITPSPSQYSPQSTAGGLAASPHNRNGPFPAAATKEPAPNTWSSVQRSIPWRQRRATAEIFMNFAAFLCLPMWLFFAIAGYRNDRESIDCAVTSTRIAAWTADLDYCQYAESHDLEIPSGLSCSIGPLPRLTGNLCDLELPLHVQMKAKRTVHAASAVKIEHLQYFSILLVTMIVIIVLAKMFSARVRRGSMPPSETMAAADREGMCIRNQMSSDIERGLPEPLTNGKSPTLTDIEAYAKFREGLTDVVKGQIALGAESLLV